VSLSKQVLEQRGEEPSSYFVEFVGCPGIAFPLRYISTLEEEEKVTRTRSGEYGGYGPQQYFCLPRSPIPESTHYMEHYSDADTTIQRSTFPSVFYDQHFVGAVEQPYKTL